MNHLIQTTDVTDYHALANALQNDMLETAKILRNALYDVLVLHGHSNPIAQELIKALEYLDYPQFVPIPNTIDALFAEYEHFEDMWWEIMNQEYPDAWASYNYGVMADDLHKHLKTRHLDQSVQETQQFPALPDELSMCDQCGKSVIHPEKAIEVAGYYCSQKCLDDSCEPQADADTETKLPDLDTEVGFAGYCGWCEEAVFEDDEESLVFDDGVFCDIYCSNRCDNEGGE